MALIRQRSRCSTVWPEAKQPAKEVKRGLMPGTVLVREYQGERHTVTVAPSGFVWRGTTYRSLSIIARAITGTAWGGPRFFGLRGPGTWKRRPSGQGTGQASHQDTAHGRDTAPRRGRTERPSGAPT